MINNRISDGLLYSLMLIHQASHLGMIAEISISLGRKLRWNPTTEKFVGDNQANQLLSAPMRSPWHL